MEYHCVLVAERLPMYMREGFAAAIWVSFASLALVTAMSPVIVWYLQ
jgi:hypothetical protein